MAELMIVKLFVGSLLAGAIAGGGIYYARNARFALWEEVWGIGAMGGVLTVLTMWGVGAAVLFLLFS